MSVLSTVKGTNDTTTADSLKRLPSKRTLQQFLIFPKNNKVTIEQSHEEVSEPGSHKKIQIETNGEPTGKLTTIKETEIKCEKNSPELLSA